MHFGGNRELYLNDFMDIFQNIDRKMMIVCLLLYPIVDHCPSESLGQNDKVFAGEFIFYFRDN